MDFDATQTPVDVVAALGSPKAPATPARMWTPWGLLYVREQVAVPVPTDRAFRIQSGGEFSLRPDAEAIWLWTDEPSGCAVILADAV